MQLSEDDRDKIFPNPLLITREHHFQFLFYTLQQKSSVGDNTINEVHISPASERRNFYSSRLIFKCNFELEKKTFSSRMMLMVEA